MSTTPPNSPASPAPNWAATVGIDWGHTEHWIALQPATGPAEAPFRLPNTPEAIHAWVQSLEQRFGGARVAVAIEASRGGLVYALREVAWITLFPVHPATSTRQRQSFRPAGGKDDRLDALVLLEVLRLHQDRLRPLQIPDADAHLLRELCRYRRQLVDQRTEFSNQLTAVLRECYPLALQLTGTSLWSPMAVDFLTRWPSLEQLQTARPETLKQFYYQHNVRSTRTVNERLAAVAAAKPLTTCQAILLPAGCKIRWLSESFAQIQKHLDILELHIDQIFRQHPDQALFANLPGAGRALRPRLLATFALEAPQLDSAAAAQRLFGLCPVIVASGQRRWVRRRFNANQFLHQTFVEWGCQAIRFCPWSKAFYEAARARGQGHWAVLRSLAFKWVRILWKCWSTHVPYDPKRYLQSLVERRSPIAARAQELAAEMGV